MAPSPSGKSSEQITSNWGTLRLRLGQLSVIPALRIMIDCACRLLCLLYTIPYGWNVLCIEPSQPLNPEEEASAEAVFPVVPAVDSAPSWSINHVHTVGKGFSDKEFLLARAAVPASPLVHRLPSPLYCIAASQGLEHHIQPRDVYQREKFRFLFCFRETKRTAHHELVEWLARKLPPASLSRVPRSLPGPRPPMAKRHLTRGGPCPASAPENPGQSRLCTWS